VRQAAVTAHDQQRPRMFLSRFSRICHAVRRKAASYVLTLASRPPPLAPGAALPVKLHPRTAHPLAQLSCSVAPPPPPPLPALAADAAATRAARHARKSSRCMYCCSAALDNLYYKVLATMLMAQVYATLQCSVCA
jgi:hypothetical protein